MIDDRPSTIRLTHQKIWPRCTPVRSERALSGAYDVQPAAALPPSTKNPASMSRPAGPPLQKHPLLIPRDGLSGGPLLCGVREFPETPARGGVRGAKTTQR